MAKIFFPSRGCVYAAPHGNNAGQSFISLSPALTSSADSPIILNGLNLTVKDLVVPKPTLGNFKILYSFGEDFGDVTINGFVMLGEVGKSNQGFKPIYDYFTQHRTSKGGIPITVSVGSSPFKLYLTGLSVGQTDATYNIQAFALGGITV